MKAQEVRLGNYIDRDGLMEVKTINQSTIRIYDHVNKISLMIGFPAESFKGIPLTEEWLIKFGFEKKYEYQKEVLSESTITVNEHMQVTLWAGEYVDGEGQYLEHVKYVHQLQNLFHALKGEELTIPS